MKVEARSINKSILRKILNFNNKIRIMNFLIKIKKLEVEVMNFLATMIIIIKINNKRVDLIVNTNKNNFQGEINLDELSNLKIIIILVSKVIISKDNNHIIIIKINQIRFIQMILVILGAIYQLVQLLYQKGRNLLKHIIMIWDSINKVQYLTLDPKTKHIQN